MPEWLGWVIVVNGVLLAGVWTLYLRGERRRRAWERVADNKSHEQQALLWWIGSLYRGQVGRVDGFGAELDVQRARVAEHGQSLDILGPLVARLAGAPPPGAAARPLPPPPAPAARSRAGFDTKPSIAPPPSPPGPGFAVEREPVGEPRDQSDDRPRLYPPEPGTPAAIALGQADIEQRMAVDSTTAMRDEAERDEAERSRARAAAPTVVHGPSASTSTRTRTTARPPPRRAATLPPLEPELPPPGRPSDFGDDEQTIALGSPTVEEIERTVAAIDGSSPPLPVHARLAPPLLPPRPTPRRKATLFGGIVPAVPPKPPAPPACATEEDVVERRSEPTRIYSREELPR